MLLRMSAAGSSLITPLTSETSAAYAIIEATRWQTELAARAESRVILKKCYRSSHMRTTLLRRTLSEDAWGVREKCAPNNSRWKKRRLKRDREKGRGREGDASERESERTKG